jgi:hypothetical protein
MNDTKKHSAGLVKLIFNVGFKQIGERNVTGFIALDQFTCTLVYSEKMIVFINDIG